MQSFQRRTLAVELMFLVICCKGICSPNPPPSPILFVHGLASSSATWDKLIKSAESSNVKFGGNIRQGQLERANKEGVIFTIDFTDNQDLTFWQQAREVSEAVELVCQQTGQKKISLVGHSMGGLAIVAYLQMFGAERVVKFVSIGTPFAGSLAAYSDALVKKLGHLDLSRKGVQSLKPSSKAMRDIYEKELPENIEYVCFISTWNPEKKLLKKIEQSWTAWLADLKSGPFESSALSFYSVKMLTKFSDGIVPTISQDIRVGVRNGSRLKVTSNTEMKAFHTDETKLAKVILGAFNLRAVSPAGNRSRSGDQNRKGLSPEAAKRFYIINYLEKDKSKVWNEFKALRRKPSIRYEVRSETCSGSPCFYVKIVQAEDIGIDVFVNVEGKYLDASTGDVIN